MHYQFLSLMNDRRKPMKALWVLITASVFLWSAPVFSEYCMVNSEDSSTSCVFKTKRNPKDAQIIVSYTKQGWSMMIAVFLKKEFAMVGGDSTVKTKNGETHPLKFVTIRRDMTINRRIMEAPVYLVDEALLHDLANAKGKVRFWLTAEDPEEVEVEFSSKLFEGLDEYVAETKMVLGDLFSDE